MHEAYNGAHDLFLCTCELYGWCQVCRSVPETRGRSNTGGRPHIVSQLLDGMVGALDGESRRKYPWLRIDR